MAPRTPLLSPSEYFEQAEHDYKLAGLGVFVVYVIAQVAMIVSLFYAIFDQATRRPAGFERAVDQAASDVLVPMLFGMIVVSIVGLLVIAAVMHYLCGGRSVGRSFGDAIAVAGWSYAPNLLVSPLDYAHARYVIERLSFRGSDPQVLQRELEAAQADGIGAIPIVLLVVTIAWSVYILAYGTAATHGEDVKNAYLPAALIGLGAFVLGVL